VNGEIEKWCYREILIAHKAHKKPPILSGGFKAFIIFLFACNYFKGFAPLLPDGYIS
jgi:hypothetical protein